MKPLKHILVILLSLAIAACSSTEESSELAADTGEQQMYEEAQRYLRNSNFDLAVRTLQLLESRFPFGKYAEQAQLELIYAHFGSYEHEAAVEAADRFIRLHPQHPNVDYAYYMKGLSAHTSNEDIFSRFLPGDETSRDISHAKEAFAEFSQLLSRYPDSSYAADARARMVHLRNLLARHEIVVANYYFRRGAYMAAANRGRYVVENFQQTPAVADALVVMAQGYILLDLDELSQDSIDVLVLNYPDHPSLDENGEFQSAYSLDGHNRSWINKLSFGLFDPPKPPQFDSRKQYKG